MIPLWTINIFGRQYLITSGDMFYICLGFNALIAAMIVVVGFLNLRDTARFLQSVVKGTTSTHQITCRLVGVLSAFTNRFSFKRNRR